MLITRITLLLAAVLLGISAPKGVSAAPPLPSLPTIGEGVPAVPTVPNLDESVQNIKETATMPVEDESEEGLPSLSETDEESIVPEVAVPEITLGEDSAEEAGGEELPSMPELSDVAEDVPVLEEGKQEVMDAPEVEQRESEEVALPNPDDAEEEALPAEGAVDFSVEEIDEQPVEVPTAAKEDEEPIEILMPSPEDFYSEMEEEEVEDAPFSFGFTESEPEPELEEAEIGASEEIEDGVEIVETPDADPEVTENTEEEKENTAEVNREDAGGEATEGKDVAEESKTSEEKKVVEKEKKNIEKKSETSKVTEDEAVKEETKALVAEVLGDSKEGEELLEQIDEFGVDADKVKRWISEYINREPYDPSKPRPTFDYNVQKLPEQIYKKFYSGKNKHLPKAVYEDEMSYYFFAAIDKADMTAVRALVQKVPSLEIKDENGNTPLIRAALHGQINPLRYFLAKGADADARNNDGNTALHIAVSIDRPDMVKALLNGGANPMVQDNQSRDSVVYAMEKGLYNYIPMLTNKSYDMNAVLDNGDTILMHAIRRGEVRQAENILRMGGNPDIRGTDGYTPLMVAAYNGLDMVVDLLIRYGADIHATDNNNGYNAMQIAEMAGNVAIARQLLSASIHQEMESAKSKPQDVDSRMLEGIKPDAVAPDAGDDVSNNEAKDDLSFVDMPKLHRVVTVMRVKTSGEKAEVVEAEPVIENNGKAEKKDPVNEKTSAKNIDKKVEPEAAVESDDAPEAEVKKTEAEAEEVGEETKEEPVEASEDSEEDDTVEGGSAEEAEAMPEDVVVEGEDEAETPTEEAPNDKKLEQQTEAPKADAEADVAPVAPAPKKEAVMPERAEETKPRHGISDSKRLKRGEISKKPSQATEKSTHSKKPTIEDVKRIPKIESKKDNKSIRTLPTISPLN